MKLLALALAVLAPSLCAQGWVKAEKTDAFTGNSYIQYTLTGRFLTPPREGAQTQPRMILQCFPGEKKYAGKWYLAGRFIKAYVETGAVLNHAQGEIPVLYRRDDGKAQSDSWGISTDGTALFLSVMQADEAFYGHFMPHKAGTTPPVVKLVLMADEYLGAGVVVQFDLAGIDDIASGCGLAMYEKK